MVRLVPNAKRFTEGHAFTGEIKENESKKIDRESDVYAEVVAAECIAYILDRTRNMLAEDTYQVAVSYTSLQNKGCMAIFNEKSEHLRSLLAPGELRCPRWREPTRPPPLMLFPTDDSDEDDDEGEEEEEET